MNENHTNQQGLTLEEIAVHKQALKIAIAEQQKNVNEAYRQVVAPFSDAKSVSGYIGGRLLNGFTMIESAIWGFFAYSENFGKAPSTLHHRKSFLYALSHKSCPTSTTALINHISNC